MTFKAVVLSLMICLILYCHALGSVPIYVTNSLSKQHVSKATIEIYTTTRPIQQIRHGETGLCGESWDAETEGQLDGSLMRLKVRAVKNGNDGETFITYENGRWEKNENGRREPPPIEVQLSECVVRMPSNCSSYYCCCCCGCCCCCCCCVENTCTRNSSIINYSGISENVDNAKINITVPEDAVVFINGKPTTKTGTNREYYSIGLKYGRTYKYIVRAQVVHNGKVIEDTKVLTLHANDNQSVAFSFPAKDNIKLTAAR